MVMANPFCVRALLMREMADLQARLKDAKNCVARNHADDVAIGNDRHLRDVFLLHAFKHGESGLIGRGTLNAVHR